MPAPHEEPLNVSPPHPPLRFYRPRVNETRVSQFAPPGLSIDRSSLPIGVTATRFCLCGNCANGPRPDGVNDPLAAFRPTVHLGA